MTKTWQLHVPEDSGKWTLLKQETSDAIFPGTRGVKSALIQSLADHDPEASWLNMIQFINFRSINVIECVFRFWILIFLRHLWNQCKKVCFLSKNSSSMSSFFCDLWGNLSYQYSDQAHVVRECDFRRDWYRVIDLINMSINTPINENIWNNIYRKVVKKRYSHFPVEIKFGFGLSHICWITIEFLQYSVLELGFQGTLR